MLQYKVPQNIGIEDKIVGPLSLRQLIIIAVGAGASYVLFAILNKLYELNILEYIVIALPAVIAVAAALIKINDISFTKFILLTFEFSVKPKKRIWDHRGIAPLVAPDLAEAQTQKITATEDKVKKAMNLDDLSRILDSGGFGHVKTVEHEDIDKAGDNELVTQAFFGNKPSETDNMYWRANKYDTTKKRLDILAKLPHVEPKKEEAKPPQPPKPVQPLKPVEPPKPPQAIKTPNGNRPRQKPPKQGPTPVPHRQNTQVNTIQKSKPVQFVPQPKKAPEPPKKTFPPPLAKKPAQAQPTGEIKLEELKKGEIEINLD